MTITLEEVAEKLNEAEVQFDVSEDGECIRVYFDTDGDVFVDLEGNPSLCIFVFTGSEGSHLLLYAEPLLDLSQARFRGVAAQAALEFMARYQVIRTQLIPDPLRLQLTIDFMLEDGDITADQIKAALLYLYDCCVISKPFFQTAMETGKVEWSILEPSEEE